MPLIPLFVQNEVEAGDDPERTSAFNFCDPFDTVMPLANSVVSALDRQHLWGLSTFLAALSTSGFTPGAASPTSIGRALEHRPGLWFLPFLLLLAL